MGFYGKKLMKRLEAEQGITLTDNTTIHRCRPGPAGRSAGAFNWVFEPSPVGGGGDLGSVETVRECAMASKLDLRKTHWNDVFIDAE